MRNNVCSAIEKWRTKLEEASINGVKEFIERVYLNAKVSKNVESFLCEACAALMFWENGFSVTMRDRPDLLIEFKSIQIGVEVKHFYRKQQDAIDEERLLKAGEQALVDDLSVLVSYGDTRETEGKSAWQEIVDVARKKVDQYYENVPNILVLFSSSVHCVEDSELSTAVNKVNEEIVSAQTPALARLNGILLVTLNEKNISGGFRQVYFTSIQYPAIPLPRDVMNTLSAIRFCRWKPYIDI